MEKQRWEESEKRRRRKKIRKEKGKRKKISGSEKVEKLSRIVINF